MSGSIHVKVFEAGRSRTGILQAGKGRTFTTLGSLMAVSEFVHKLKDAVPGSEYRVVKVGKNRYNIISIA